MKITVIGTGYVGLVSAGCFAEQGNDVVCLDIDEARIQNLKDGRLPIYEPGLKELFTRNSEAGRLLFTDDVAASVAHGDVQFIAVGTPAGEDGSADLRYVLSAAANIGRHMEKSKVVVDKSTVPVGTAEKVSAAITAELKRRNREDIGAVAVANPEFLKEGAAINDFMRPDRIVIGIDGHTSEAQRARQVMRTLYAPFNRNHERIIMMDVRSAEFTKYAANAMLATRISFMNELANLADRVGADIEMVRQGIGSDSRIGYSFLYAGTGYGGSCFPKDVQALQRTAQENGMGLGILKAVEDVNERQKHVLVDKIVGRFGEDLSGKRFAVWGLAFKPETNDMRQAPSREIVKGLVGRGASVCAHDPVAMPEAKEYLAHDLEPIPGGLQQVDFAVSPMAALDGADALVIVTEWKPFKGPDFEAVKMALRSPLIFDGRNLYDPHLMRQLGIEYHAIGRSSIAGSPMRRILVTGGAGFLGSHLCERLLDAGNEVICADNYFTGARANIAHLLANPRFEAVRHDVTFPLYVEVDEIYNLACPASPVHYQHDPVQTTKTSVHGAINMLGLAKRTGAKILQASTSEVYGDPEVHPQTEDYWGRVNPIGIRSCYDEGKRCAETLFFDYWRQHSLKIKVVRIFNTYGPRMHPQDGRVVSNFIMQALRGQDITIYGDGAQTRSFCYVDDLIEAMIRAMATSDDFTGPVNIGNPGEFTILQLAGLVIELTGSKSNLIRLPLPSDDPRQRQPDITLAKKTLDGWEPAIALRDGLQRTIAYFKSTL